jgi:hypothetical protein
LSRDVVGGCAHCPSCFGGDPGGPQAAGCAARRLGRCGDAIRCQLVSATGPTNCTPGGRAPAGRPAGAGRVRPRAARATGSHVLTFGQAPQGSRSCTPIGGAEMLVRVFGLRRRLGDIGVLDLAT